MWCDVKWSEVKWSEVKWSEVKWSEVNWTELNWSEVKWRSEVKQEQKREDTCGFLEFFREGKKKHLDGLSPTYLNPPPTPPKHEKWTQPETPPPHCGLSPSIFFFFFFFFLNFP